MIDSIPKNFTVFPLCEGNTYIAVCPDLGTVDQGTTPESAFVNLKKTTEIYLQAASLNITPNLISTNVLNLSPPSLPQVSPSRFIATLERLGFIRTSHCVVLKKQSEIGKVICVVPLRYPVASATIWNLLSSAGIDRQDFLEKL